MSGGATQKQGADQRQKATHSTSRNNSRPRMICKSQPNTKKSAAKTAAITRAIHRAIVLVILLILRTSPAAILPKMQAGASAKENRRGPGGLGGRILEIGLGVIEPGGPWHRRHRPYVPRSPIRYRTRPRPARCVRQQLWSDPAQRLSSVPCG